MIEPVPAFELAADRAARVIADPAVAARWEEPGVLPRMTVGAVAGHLLAVVRTLERRCDTAVDAAADVVDPASSYAQVRLDRDTDLDDPGFLVVREGAARQAQRGPAAVAERFVACVTRVGARLRTDPPELIQLREPTQCTTLSAYLKTRIVELVIHTDDLVVSTRMPVEPPDPEVATLVIEFLITADRRRIGDTRVLRALAGRTDPGPLRAI